MAGQQLANEKSKIKFDMSGLDSIIKAMKKDYVVRVGIIGSKAKSKHDNDSNLTNAEIGAIHEQPDRDGVKIPRRSFLEDAIKEKLDFSQQAMKPIKKKLFFSLFVKYSPKMFFEDLGAKAIWAVEEAFATNGFGRWQPLSEQAIRTRVKKARTKKAKEEAKHYHNILTLTGKLRHSIGFKVIDKKQ